MRLIILLILISCDIQKIEELLNDDYHVRFYSAGETEIHLGGIVLTKDTTFIVKGVDIKNKIIKGYSPDAQLKLESKQGYKFSLNIEGKIEMIYYK